MKRKGIDLSGYNVVTDYDRAAADDVDFVILKIIRKDMQPDKLFEKHWNGFERAGVPIQGVYNYSYANTVEKFRSDAQRVVDVLAGRKTMVWLDIEHSSLAGMGQKLIDGINAYAEVIRGAGLQFGIYTYLAFWHANMNRFSDQLNYKFWIARYPSSQPVDNDNNPIASKCPDIGKELYGWQWSSTGLVDGIKGFVDLDEWYVDIEAAEVAPVQPEEQYISGEGFRRELARTLNLPETETPEQILAETVTISARSNRYHASVTPLERLMKAHGHYSGNIEADAGKRPNFGNGMAKATALYQAREVGLKYPDKEWTAGKASYRKALRITS